MKRIYILLPLLFLFWGGDLLGQKIEHLGRNINTEFEDREPILSPDGKTMYIWRRKNPNNTGGLIDQGDIWVSKMQANGQFGPSRKLAQPVNSPGLDFVWQVSPTEDTLYLSMTGRNFSTGINYIVRQGLGWSEPHNMRIRGYIPRGKYKDYFIAKSGVMMIPNQGPDTYGGPDLYVCLPLTDSLWDTPINLGPTINTAGGEDAPYLMPDGKTLFFNSNGHSPDGPPVVGKDEIYVSTRLDDTWRRWTKPERVGAPLGTPGYDADFWITEDSMYVYWISDYKTYGDIDIFRIKIKDCAVDLYPGGDQVFCEGEDVTLEGGFTLGEGLSHQWQKDGVDIPGATSRHLDIDESGTYRLIRHKDGCVDTSANQMMTFIPKPQVAIQNEGNILCEQTSLELRAMSAGAASWEWSQNGLVIPGANESVYQVKRAGTYWVKVSNGACGSTSKPVYISKMVDPVIYPADQALNRARARPYEWLWTREFSTRKENLLFRDVSVDEAGNTALLTYKQKGKSYVERLIYFTNSGTLKWQVDGESTKAPTNQFVQIDFEGNVLVTSQEHFLRKYNARGELLWEKRHSVPWVSGLTTDPLGHVYAMGRFKESVQIDDTTLSTKSGGAVFLAKFDPFGKRMWVRKVTADFILRDYGNAVQCDAAGNVYMSGAFDLVASAGPNQLIRGSLRADNFFLVKFTPYGEVQWTRRYSTEKAPFHTSDMATDERGFTYLLHNHKLAKYDPKGRLIWNANVQTPGNTTPRAARIAVDGQGTLFTLGITNERNNYFLTRTDRKGKALTIWGQNSGAKDLNNLPVIGTNEAGNLFLAARATGRAPDRNYNVVLPAFLTSFGEPERENELDPLALCPGESMTLFAKLSHEVPFYWLKDGQPIEGATDTMLVVTEPGRYQVRVFMSTCERYSNVQEVQNCYQNLEKDPPKPPKTETPPITQNTPKPPKTPPTPKPKKDPDPDPEVVPVQLKTKASGQPTTLNDRKVNKQGSVKISNPTATIAVWDHGAMDSDTISLNVNGVWLLENFPLRKERKELVVEFDPNGANFIILYAHNLGTIPPNTASVSISDGKKTQTLKLKSSLNNCGSINVKFE